MVRLGGLAASIVAVFVPGEPVTAGEVEGAMLVRIPGRVHVEKAVVVRVRAMKNDALVCTWTLKVNLIDLGRSAGGQLTDRCSLADRRFLELRRESPHRHTALEMNRRLIVRRVVGRGVRSDRNVPIACRTPRNPWRWEDRSRSEIPTEAVGNEMNVAGADLNPAAA